MQQNTWATHYKFIKFGQFSEHLIPKDELQTWFDLKYDLDDYVGIDHRFIDVVINGKLVFYADDTLLQDIDIKAEDACLVLCKPTFDKNKDDEVKRKNEYILASETQIEQNRIKIQNRNSDPFFKGQSQKIQASQQNKQLYKLLIKQFSKWEVLVAFNHCEDPKAIRGYLEQGKAQASLSRRIERQQKIQIDQFLKRKVMVGLKETVFSVDKSVETYGHIMRQLYHQYPYFKQLELNHQAYIQRKLLGVQLYPSRNTQIQQKVKRVLAEAHSKQDKHITPQEVSAFKGQHSQTYSQHDINNALRQSGNNLRHAAQLLRGKVDNQKNLVLCLKKSSRLNLILQFFSQPTFEKIRLDLVGNAQKCEGFIKFIINKYKSQSYLISLIKKYRLYIITILSGNYSLEAGAVSCSKSQLILQKHLSEEEQRQQRQTIQESLDHQLVQCLKSHRVSQTLAVASVRAASNQIEQVGKYLALGGINKKYDFCPPKIDQEQKYLQKYFKKDKDSLVRLKNEQYYTLWLGSIKQTSPLLFEMIIRNKRLMDRLIASAAENR